MEELGTYDARIWVERNQTVDMLERPGVCRGHPAPPPKHQYHTLWPERYSNDTAGIDQSDMSVAFGQQRRF